VSAGEQAQHFKIARRARQIGLQFGGGHAPVLSKSKRSAQRRAEQHGGQGG